MSTKVTATVEGVWDSDDDQAGFRLLKVGNGGVLGYIAERHLKDIKETQFFNDGDIVEDRYGSRFYFAKEGSEEYFLGIQVQANAEPFYHGDHYKLNVEDMYDPVKLILPGISGTRVGGAEE